MRARDVSVAAVRAGIGFPSLCDSLDAVIPVLYALRQSSSGWKFWLRWGINALLGALEEWRRDRCVDIPTPDPET
jgi:hypothetical protein